MAQKCYFWMGQYLEHFCCFVLDSVSFLQPFWALKNMARRMKIMAITTRVYVESTQKNEEKM